MGRGNLVSDSVLHSEMMFSHTISQTHDCFCFLSFLGGHQPTTLLMVALQLRRNGVPSMNVLDGAAESK